LSYSSYSSFDSRFFQFPYPDSNRGTGRSVIYIYDTFYGRWLIVELFFQLVVLLTFFFAPFR